MKVLELMTKDPIFCRSSDTVRQVARVIRDHELVLIPVVNDLGKIVGVITDRDLCCNFLAEGGDPDRETVQRYMTSKPITCRLDDEVIDCERLMWKHGVRRLPVVNEDGYLVGIVSPLDLLDKPESLVSREFIRALRSTMAKHGNHCDAR
jgi:CBS domain-containing protein